MPPKSRLRLQRHWDALRRILAVDITSSRSLDVLNPVNLPLWITWLSFHTGFEGDREKPNWEIWSKIYHFSNNSEDIFLRLAPLPLLLLTPQSDQCLGDSRLLRSLLWNVIESKRTGCPFAPDDVSSLLLFRIRSLTLTHPDTATFFPFFVFFAAVADVVLGYFFRFLPLSLQLLQAAFVFLRLRACVGSQATRRGPDTVQKPLQTLWHFLACMMTVSSSRERLFSRWKRNCAPLQLRCS